ncbi:DUF7832 domain-containing protein [Flavihumibacter petaseus]|uniref:DUF7832 domain-containing protein n=1 Tax=Flavihumibacter petaseus NBRC 106054 TaxID=1220578 RepID=A0A0E9MWA8_9BACT|nr:hypothetical protein [Flavihumibacter petaseus]GAO41385.1 hypothetical protein FPE01S_01_03970 [Flavihumibacter petaseus NBRC 106054]
MASIDRMDWHYGGDFPENLPPVNGGTHIGMYLTWIIHNDLIGQLHLDDSFDDIQKVKLRQKTGRDFLIEQCDEKFWDEDLSNEGLEFTKYYYEGESIGNFRNYIDDYCEILGKNVESLYQIDNTWENYEKLSPMLDYRFSEWKNKK